MPYLYCAIYIQSVLLLNQAETPFCISNVCAFAKAILQIDRKIILKIVAHFRAVNICTYSHDKFGEMLGQVIGISLELWAPKIKFTPEI